MENHRSLECTVSGAATDIRLPQANQKPYAEILFLFLLHFHETITWLVMMSRCLVNINNQVV